MSITIFHWSSRTPVLDEVLIELRDQGEFASKGRHLGHRMRDSRGSLPWHDYPLVDSGKKARNDLAHKAIIAPIADCKKYVDAIEAELKAWGVL